MKSFLATIISLFCAFGLLAGPQPQIAQNQPPLDPKNIDSSVKPGDNFFNYANGAWIRRTEIPPEYSRWGAFNELIERNNDALHTIAEKASQTPVDPKLAPETQKVGDYYASGMDEKAVEAARIQPLADEFQKIDAMKDQQDVLKEIAHLHSIGINAFFNFGSGPDARNITLVEAGDINVHQPEFFKAANDLFKTTSLDDWKAYLRWHLINATAPYLSRDFVDENFDFNERTLRGTQQDKPRWKRVVISEDGDIGEALGKLYVGFYFPPAAKERALELVNNLKEALADRIKTLDWMDEPTKQEALKKLAAMNVKIGYPDKWLDYSLLPIDRGPYVLNALRAAKFESDRDVQKIGKPVDRTDWGMTPPTVNAYYQPNMNEIVFPAGILQPPFFYANADDAVNYGGIGAVIGHEMTHGFDDQGRQFDAAGNLRDWWTPESAAKFKERSQAIVKQFNEYEPLPGLHVNGELTQGENIADLGGVKLAYAALQKALDKNPQERNKKIDGFTPEQRFFLSFAAIWRSKIRDEDQKLRLNTDPHSPAQFRVNGPLSNLPEFRQAFNIPDGSPMARPADKRVNIW